MHTKPKCLLVVLMVFLHGFSVYSQPPVSVLVNGVPVNFDVNPINLEGRILVPLRGIFESLGVSPQWDEKTQTVTAQTENIQVTLPIGSKHPTVNGQVVELDVAAMILDGRTMVPTRFIAESLGATVDWDEASHTVVIRESSVEKTDDSIRDKAYIHEKMGFHLTVPSHWEGRYLIEETEDSVSFYSQSVRDVEGFHWGGWLFTIYRTEDTPEIREQIKEGITPSEIIAEQHGVLFKKIGPSDVQFPHENQRVTEEYFALYDETHLITDSFAFR
ncbi:copper amine oxidase N-terminal domain-containing protein [Tindallia californiensis]|nr:copper amine oxidase N-terminal domain-containing protein [Tindallia californiensis]